MPALLKAGEQLGDRVRAQPELRLVGQESVQLAWRLRTANHEDPQHDVRVPADPGRLERALEQPGDGALGFGDVLSGQDGCLWHFPFLFS